jgi:hypothetical protein
MGTILRSSLLAVAALTRLLADDPAWKNKPVSQWDEQDAKQVLAASPWVGNVKLEEVRYLSKAERRDSGDWEAGRGPTVGLAGTGILGPTRAAAAIERAHQHPDYGTVVVRWESASPVRAAEVKAGESEIPTWQGDYYAIAVYDVPLASRWNLANELKGVASLHRDKKKDVKPSRVLILPQDAGVATVVYLFPRSAEISKKDHNVRFVAQLRRLYVSQFFFPEEMQLQGQPEL